MKKIPIKNSLPKGWVRISIADTGEYINGFAFKPSHRENKGLPIIRIQNLTDEYKPLNRTTLAVPREYQVATGDILMSWSATLDVFVWRREPALVNQHIFKVVPDKRLIDERLLFYWLKLAIEQLLETEHLHGSTMKHINRGPFMAHEVVLPPRTEQTRIVEKLEELLSDLDAGVAELKAAREKLARHRQSLLKAAVEGALTAQWRAAQSSDQPTASTESGMALLARILTERRSRWETRQLAKFQAQGKTPPKDWQAKYPAPAAPDTAGLPALPDGWIWASLDMLSEIQGGIQKQPSRAPVKNKYSFLRVANIARGKLKLDEVHQVELFDGESERLALKKGDLLIVEGNGSLSEIGRCAVWDGSIENTVHQNHLIRARPVLMDSKFIEAWINSLHGIEKITKFAATTSGLFTLSIKKISKIPVPVPSFSEQTACINLLGSALEKQRQQLETIQISLKQSAAQRKNILQAAFSGQLVPQDSADEPASVLLERIRADRAEREKQPKVRKTKQQKEIAAVVRKLINVLAEAGDWVSAQEVFRCCGVVDGALTDQIEAIYAELRDLDKAGRLAVETVTDAQGRKLHDKLKLLVD